MVAPDLVGSLSLPQSQVGPPTLSGLPVVPMLSWSSCAPVTEPHGFACIFAVSNGFATCGAPFRFTESVVVVVGLGMGEPAPAVQPARAKPSTATVMVVRRTFAASVSEAVAGRVLARLVALERGRQLVDLVLDRTDERGVLMHQIGR